MPLPLAAAVALEGVGRGPSADGLPPFSVPLRFFLTAALFGVVGGGLLAWSGAPAVSSRWMPQFLAVTHLMTLGVLGMVMAGALFQVVPVLGGGGLPRARLLAHLVHPALAGGTACLAVGLGSQSPNWLQGAVVLLGVAGLLLGSAVAVRVARSRAPALRPIRLALLAGVAGIGLGIWMAAASAWPAVQFAYRTWTNVHAAWAGAGLGLLLIFGVAQQVLPMFHVTPPFAARVAQWLPRLHVLALVLMVLPRPWSAIGCVILALAAGGFALAGLDLLRRRRRRRRDAAVLAWQGGLSAIVVALVVVAVAAGWPSASTVGWWFVVELPVGVLFGVGGLGTILIGMLTKIVPFLAFLHLQRAAVHAGKPAGQVPAMAHFLSDRIAHAQVGLHLAAGVALVAATFLPTLTTGAGLLLAADFAVLFAWLARAAWRYRVAWRLIS